MAKLKVTKFNRKYVMLVFFLFFSFLLLLTQENKPPRTNIIKKIGLWIISPFQKTAAYTVMGMKKIYRDASDLGNLKEKNIELKKKLDLYKKEENIFREVILENKRLRQLLDLKQHYYEYTLIPAEIIGKDPTNWFNTILIDCGYNDGIRENMIVITYNGVVGKIIEVAKNVSKVQLILDLNSSVGAMINRSRAVGILRGFSKEFCELEYVQRTEDVKIGDIVITSGLGGVFQKGLPLGTVKTIEKKNYGLFQKIIVAPFVNVYNIEEVMIIKNMDTTSRELSLEDDK